MENTFGFATVQYSFLNPGNPKSPVTGLYQRWGACGGAEEVSHDENMRFAYWSTSLLEKIGG